MKLFGDLDETEVDFKSIHMKCIHCATKQTLLNRSWEKSSVHPCTRSTTFGRGKKGADNKGETKRAQNKKGAGKKGAEQKGRGAKRAQNKKGARSRCCVTVTFKVVISSDNRVLSITFALFKICFNKKLENGRKLQHKTMILRIESYLIDRIICFA